MRISSIVIAICHLVVGGFIAHATGKFQAIYTDLLSDDTSLPGLTQIVLSMTPFGWIAFGVIAAACLIGKDSVQSLRRTPNWPFALTLLFVGMAAVIGLFLPLVIIIEAIGTKS